MGTTSAQLVWRGSPGSGLRLEVGGREVEVAAAEPAFIHLSRPGRAMPTAPRSGPGAGRLAHARYSYLEGGRFLDARWPGGPGSVVLEDLAPATTYEVVARARGVPPFLACRFTTLRPPPGRLLARFATVSDVHIGEKHFGITGRIHDLGRPAYPVRALQAALDEAAAWGAGTVVVKGDLTRQATPAEVRDYATVLAGSPLAAHTMLGNHDSNLGVNVVGLLGSLGSHVELRPQALELPGLRLVLVNTMHADPHFHRGHLPAEEAEEVARLAASAGGPVWVAMHHPPELHPWPTCYPPGVPHDQSMALLGALSAANPSVLVTCGHRHRNRRYNYGDIVISEVGSTKDYPGCWAGYEVYEGGLVQVVRRTARPDVLAWTEATRRALNGQWGRWSPGRLDDRCFAITWPAP